MAQQAIKVKYDTDLLAANTTLPNDTINATA